MVSVWVIPSCSTRWLSARFRFVAASSRLQVILSLIETRSWRSIPGQVLQRLPEVGGVVMVNFFTCYLSDECQERDVTVLDVVKHINHIR